MKKFLVLIVATILVIVTGCKTTTTTQQTTEVTTISNAEKVQKATEALVLNFSEIHSNQTLPTTGLHGATISWISNNPTVFSSTGVFTRPNLNTTVKLIAVVSVGSESLTKDFVVTAIGKTAQERLVIAQETLTLSFTEVSANVTLPTKGTVGQTISWISNNPAVLSNTGVYTKPDLDTNVKLIAMISIDGLNTTKDFVVKVIGKTVDERIAEAKDALTFASTEVKGDLTLAAKGKHSSTITWVSDKPEVLGNDGKFTNPAADTEVKLTATIKIGETTVTKEFTLTVKSLTVAEKLEAAKTALALTSTDVTASITLPATGLYGTTITWASANTAVLGNDGTYTAPTAETKVKLTATITLEGQTVTKEIEVTVKPAAQQ